jgi:hypothetical protein
MREVTAWAAFTAPIWVTVIETCGYAGRRSARSLPSSSVATQINSDTRDEPDV